MQFNIYIQLGKIKSFPAIICQTIILLLISLYGLQILTLSLGMKIDKECSKDDKERPRDPDGGDWNWQVAAVQVAVHDQFSPKYLISLLILCEKECE